MQIGRKRSLKKALIKNLFEPIGAEEKRTLKLFYKGTDRYNSVDDVPHNRRKWAEFRVHAELGGRTYELSCYGVAQLLEAVAFLRQKRIEYKVFYWYDDCRCCSISA